MYGSGAFVPSPPIFIGYAPPAPEFGSAFYNPGRGADGSAELITFTQSLAQIFDLLPTSEATTVINEMENEVKGFDFYKEIGPVGGSGRDALKELSDPASTQDLVDVLMSLESIKKSLDDDVISKLGGKELSAAEALFSQFGVFDSQMLLPLLKEYNLLASQVTAEKEKLKKSLANYVEGLNEDSLRALCVAFDVPVVTDRDGKFDQKGTVSDLERALNQALDNLMSFQSLDADLLAGVGKTLQVSSVTPAVGVVGNNMVGRSTAAIQESNAKRMKDSAEDAEKASKRADAKAASQRRADAKEALTKMEKNALANKAQGRKKI